MGGSAISLDEATARLCAPGALFEMETVEVRGQKVRTWKNQPPTLPDLARYARSSFAANELMVMDDDRVTYEGWFRAVAALAASLQRSGVKQGDRVAIAMRNMPEWPVAFFAAASVGAIAVPLNGWWQAQELCFGLRDSGASVLICDDRRYDCLSPYFDQLPDLHTIWVAKPGTQSLRANAMPLESLIGSPAYYGSLPDCDLPDVALHPDDDVTIFYTSGTTGQPKGSVGTHRNVLTCALANAFSSHRASLRRGEEPPAPKPSIGLLVIPLFHVTACNASLMSTLMTGSKLIMMRKWDTLVAMALIEREKVTITGGVPTIAWQLLEHPERHRFDLSSLETISYGGAPAAPELVRLIDRDLHAFPGNGWGMTETSATVTVHVGEDYLLHPNSCGLPLPVSNLKIMSVDGMTELPVGEVGELWASGPQIANGYWRNPDATAATFIDGWVRTGDLARLDEEGFCYIVDRAKDIVIRGGENIYCIEVENVLFEHPAVIDASLVGIPHRTLGEVPVAVVQLASGAQASEAELQAWVRDRLAAFKTPAQIRFCDQPLPRNANGKVLKAELRSLFEPT